MELNTYPLVCTRGVVLYPNQEIVIDVGRDTSVHAVENAQDNYDKKICLFSQKELEQENDSDIIVIEEGYITITPVNIDMTNNKKIEILKNELL